MLVRDAVRRQRSIMKDPEVQRMCNWMKQADLLEMISLILCLALFLAMNPIDGLQPNRLIPCFPSVKPPCFPDGFVGFFNPARLHRKRILDEFIKKKMKRKESLRNLKKLRKRLKEIMRKEKEDENLSETQGEEDVGGGVEDSHGNRKELMLDVSASMQVDQPRCTTSPYEQTGNLMVGGLKVCTTEAEKKTGSYSEGV